ncbi:CLUMA_CG006591, isoform A [Clunio marinus]|uniref:Protein farnesyltransferase/geranylgeranyltransferase type-1 subunit alpha n=1 Tax=Clunio marinus TaxID=568069 RepID=A0A1J1I2E5_9DIPT|nr:CLUMA_CG006591, isoform A [Clunio marinus]
MPHYKVMYFNLKALAEPIRLLLSYGKLEFEDVRVERENWPALKPSMPMGQMPILEVDGKRVHQSTAICRYLAKEVGLAGSNTWEDLEIDIAVDTINDLRSKIAIVSYEEDQKLQATKREKLEAEILPFYLEKLDALAKENNGHFALKKLTWADLHFVGILDYLNYMVKYDFVAKYPNLKKVVDNVLSVDNIKKWIEKRPYKKLVFEINLTLKDKMSDSSDEDFNENYVMYKERLEWRDVKPIKQNDGANPVVAIAYSEKFADVYNYFRGILAIQEKSERALELTTNALRLNAANYTYRREILKTLNKDLYQELGYIADVIHENPKNYQVWHHRRVIVEWLNDPSFELELTETILDIDAKNYHAWQHRQWAIQTYDLFDNELAYIDKLLSMDVRNNSAWNQRFFVLKHIGLTDEVVQMELHYAMNRIRLIKNNESSWNFLKGLLEFGDNSISKFPDVELFAEELYNTGNRSPYLLAFLVDMYIEKTMHVYKTNNYDDPEIYARKVCELCDMLANHYDTIRYKYWKYVQQKFKDDKEQAKQPIDEPSEEQKLNKIKKKKDKIGKCGKSWKTSERLGKILETQDFFVRKTWKRIEELKP